MVSMLIDPRLIRIAVDGPLAAGDVGGTVTICLWMGLNILFRAALTTWELRMTTAVGVQVVDALRRDVFDHIQRLHMRYFDRTKQGRIIARADRDVDTLEQLVFWGPIFFTSLVLSMALGLVWLFASNAGLALWLVVAMPLVWVTTRVFHRYGFPAYRRIRETHSAISAQVAEAITGVRVVQAFGQERRELDELEARQGLYRAAVHPRRAHRGGLHPEPLARLPRRAPRDPRAGRPRRAARAR